VPALINAPGAQLRVQVFRIPGSPFGWELTHFGAIDLHPGQPRPTDPGAARLIVEVRDLDPILAALKRAGAPVISRGEQAVAIGGGKRAVMVRDPDGYPVTVAEVAPSAGAPEGNVVGARMGLSVSDLEKTRRFYADLLGFEVAGSAVFGKSDALLDLAGTPPGTELRRLNATVPGTAARIEFTEFRGLERTPFHQRVPDPGTPAVAFRVTDLDDLVARLKSAGVTVVSQGEQPAQFSPTIRNIFIDDPNGFKIELFEQTQ
jgi:catechol 2,3-dioxygenase-like lactoylglutathione lyase family enzyme